MMGLIYTFSGASLVKSDFPLYWAAYISQVAFTGILFRFRLHALSVVVANVAVVWFLAVVLVFFTHPYLASW